MKILKALKKSTNIVEKFTNQSQSESKIEVEYIFMYVLNVTRPKLYEQFNNTLTDYDNKKIENILDSRLADLTPKDIKDIIQRMIKEHLGWLVVWGGFFGGLLGFILSPVALNLI